MAQKIQMLCMYQQSSLSDKQIKTLEKETQKLYRKHFGKQYKITPLWLEIPPGQAYIAAQPSSASTVSLPVANCTSDSVRHPFMSDFCEMWMDITYCNENEIILNVSDLELAEESSRRSRALINPKARLRLGLKIVARLIKSKLTKGYLHSSVNLNN